MNCYSLNVRSFTLVAVVLSVIIIVQTLGPPAFAQNKTLRIGVRADAAPFSARWERDEDIESDRKRSAAGIDPADPNAANPTEGERDGIGENGSQYYGYSVELCLDFARTEGYDVEFEPVDPSNRFDKLAGTSENRIDILCGATTATLNVMKYFDVSLYTFLTATSYLVAPGIEKKIGSGPGSITIGFREKTTADPTDKVGRDDLRQRFATLLKTPTGKFRFKKKASHDDAVSALISGDPNKHIDLYVADRPILVSALNREIARTLRALENLENKLAKQEKADEGAKNQPSTDPQTAGVDAKSGSDIRDDAEREGQKQPMSKEEVEKAIAEKEQRLRLLKEGVVVSTDVLHIQPYALVLPKCSEHLFRLNHFLAERFRSAEFVEKWKARFGYDFDVAMEKIIEFQTSIPVGASIDVERCTWPASQAASKAQPKSVATSPADTASQ
ncbi:transporter substrate-binding domain-containing protein [Hwanghaeella grinnelliae]|nr:transporter substrate-binding domain-containing protein [Hwanghaeella grinnelliae]